MSKNNKRVLKTQKKKTAVQEVGRLGQALRLLGGYGGGIAGGLFGQPAIGRSIGTNLGASVSKWLGSGDYAVKSNSLVNQMKSSGDIPMMHKTSQSVIVRHKEYLADIYSAATGSPSAFSIQSFPLNPGVELTFPWLCNIARNYQEYTIRGMIFHIESTSGESVAAANTTLGSVMMCTNYRATSAAPTSKIELLNEFFSSDAKPSESFCHPIECDPRENPYNVQYVRSSAVPAGEDLKTYDLGTMYVATQGMQANNVNLGELWVSYEVELRKPKATALVGAGTTSFVSSLAGSYATGTAFATALNTSTINSLGVVWSSAAANVTATLPVGSAGTYVLAFATPSVGAPSTNFAACTVTNANVVYGYNAFANGVTANPSWVTCTFQVLDPSKVATVTIMTAAGWITINGASTTIGQITSP